MVFDGISKPSIDEAEVTVFGPSFGEAIIIHLGNNEWLCVDSCINPATGRAVALDYFDAIEVEYDRIVGVVATHWHSDHIKGLSQILKVSRSASFTISGIFSKEEFKSFIAPYLSNCKTIPNSGASELAQIINELESSDRRPILGSENKLIIDKPNIKVKALSPSDHAVMSTIARLSSEESCKFRRGMPKLRANDSSVALLISIGQKKLLLGADLEVKDNNRKLGWLAVVDLCSEYDKASFIKVSHHGSKNGDHSEIWSKLLDDEPYAVVTPFLNGRVKLPTQEDINRLKSRTSNAFLTAEPKPAKLKGLDRTVLRTLAGATISLEAFPKWFGGVRMRSSFESGEGWNVEKFGEAISLGQN